MNTSASRALALALALPGLGAALAAPLTPNPNVPEIEWVEAAIPPAPAFRAEGLIAVDMPPQTSVRVGVDPDTLAIGGDGVVRYVAVMTNLSGSVSALYETLHCATKEVKTHARWSKEAGWKNVAEPQWRYWNDNMPSRHAIAIARQGACDGLLPPANPAAIVRAMREPSKIKERERY
ncbi:MAG: CNP1-like family protein [Rhodoferax sp.]